MAKGNMLLGYSRGSVGDVTFYRSGGSQRQRARNRQPNNPRTAKQMTQRSKFANAVKFFKQINTDFFKFAFEDRKTNESDYNAFMRHNVVNSGYIGAQASKISDWPALGLWQLSAGSLPEIVAPFPQPQHVTAGIAFDLGVTLPNNVTTVGELSTELINGNSSVWRSGDILTYVVYRATNANTLPTVDTEEDHRVYSAYGQLILNESDTTALLDIVATVGGVPFALAADDEGLKVQGDDSGAQTIWDNDFVGIAVIHSRNSANGLFVSPSTMIYNKRELPLLAMYDSGSFYNAVIADWQASADAILQGGSLQSTYSPPSLLGRYNASYEVIALPYEQEVTNAISGNELRLKVANGENLTANMFTLEGVTGTCYVRKSTSAGAPNDAYILSVTFSPSMQVDDTFTVKFDGSVIWTCTRVS